MLKIHLEIVTGEIFKLFDFSSFFYPPSFFPLRLTHVTSLNKTGNLWFKTLESLYVFRHYCVLNFSGGLAMWWLYIQIWTNEQTVVGGAGFLLHHEKSSMTGNIYFSMHPPTRANQSHLGTPGPGYSQALASGYRTLAAHVINLAHLAAPLPASPAVPQVQLTHSHPGRIWINAHRSRACRRGQPRSLDWSVCTHRRRLPTVVALKRFVSVWATGRKSHLLVSWE
jgi:hypothetical protein